MSPRRFVAFETTDDATYRSRCKCDIFRQTSLTKRACPRLSTILPRRHSNSARAPGLAAENLSAFPRGGDRCITPVPDSRCSRCDGAARQTEAVLWPLSPGVSGVPRAIRRCIGITSLLNNGAQPPLPNGSTTTALRSRVGQAPLGDQNQAADFPGPDLR